MPTGSLSGPWKQQMISTREKALTSSQTGFEVRFCLYLAVKPWRLTVSEPLYYPLQKRDSNKVSVRVNAVSHAKDFTLRKCSINNSFLSSFTYTKYVGISDGTAYHHFPYQLGLMYKRMILIHFTTFRPHALTLWLHQCQRKPV